MTLFHKNKYTKIYYNIIKNSKNKKYNELNIKTENHHIIPKSLGGDNSKENIVEVSCREHYVLHKLLVKMVIQSEHKKKMYWALHRMSTSFLKFYNSRMYDIFRNEWSKYIKNNHHSKYIHNWSEIMSEKVSKSWENDIFRKKKTSETMKKTIEKIRLQDEESYLKEMKDRAKRGGIVSKERNSTKIEYNGFIYNGWNEFKSETGISKDNYKKYYMNGYDPSIRIGKDGPLNINDILYYSSINNKTVLCILHDMNVKNIITDNKMKTLINEYERRISR